MAIVNRHVNARLQATNATSDVIQTFQRVRPGLRNDVLAVESMLGAVAMIQGPGVAGASLTITTALEEE